ncbi:MAG: asparagine synthase B [Bacilli bacterium]|nr:asparagine synthase B [Bacilli bacterium]
MCGIIVSSGGLQKIEQLKKGQLNTIKRGPDAKDYKVIGDYVFMFNRLAIMGLSMNGMQPFYYKNNILVANAEIYNFRQIKQEMSKRHVFQSESDCEILLPLYEELGVEMFAYLDAEYAIVLYDDKIKGLVAGRDPIGIRPLFYGYIKETSEIVFASEVKAIIDVVETVFPFPPGHYYIKGEFIKYSDLLDIEKYHTDLFEDILININRKLTEGIVKRLDSDAEIGYLLSGGLDSSLVCSVAAKVSTEKIRTFSVGMETDPIDLKYAKIVADYLQTDHTEVIIKKADVINSLDEVIYALETYDITTIRASIGMYLISKYIHENTNIKVLLTGEVSDELFGYKYTDFAPDEDAFQKEAEKRVRELYMYDVLRADRCLAANSLEARVPFGDLDFVNYVMRIHPIFKMNKYSTGKFLLRKAFEGDYLPHEILYRDKAAFSDAVGHSLVDYLKEYAESCYSDEVFVKKCTQYANPTPFTKESLLYREIFEKYYPNHSHLVMDYWMPNKTWENCDVSDPSARVLSNYGDSGK